MTTAVRAHPRATAIPGPRRSAPAGGRARGLRHHRRPRQGDDAPVALPAGAARPAALPDRRRGRRRLDGRRPARARARGDRGRRASRSTPRSSTASPRGCPTCRATSPTRRPSSASRRALKGARSPVFYLEIPPFLFGAVVKGLAGAGLTEGARVVVEKPFGHDLESARALAAEMHEYLDESQLFRIDHFLGKMGLVEILYLRFANAMLEPVWNRNYVASRPDHDGRELRRRGPRPLLRPGRRAARRRRQPPDAGRRRGGDGGAGRPRPDDGQGRLSPVFARCPPPTRRTTSAASTTATATIAGVAPDSDDRDLRGDAAGDRQLALVGRAVLHPHRQAAARRPRRSCGSCSSARRGLGFHAGGAQPEPDQLIVKLDPTTGVGCLLEAQHGDPPDARAVNLDMEFGRRGRRGPGAVRGAAARGDAGRQHRASRARTASRRRGASWQPLLDGAAARASVRAGVVGTAPRRTGSWPATGAGTSRGWRHEPLRRHHHRQRRRAAARSSTTWRRRASGSCCSSAATGCRASRRTGRRATSSSTTATSRRTPGTTSAARRSSRRSTTASAARPSSTAPRCTGCAPRTSASCATTTASRRRGRSPTTRWSRTTRAPSSSTRSTARAGRTRPSRPRARRTRSRRSATSRASSSSRTISPRPGYHPFHAPCGVMLHEARHAAQPLRPLRHLRRVPLPRARQVRRRGARRAAGARAPERHAVDERRGGAARDERATAAR